MKMFKQTLTLDIRAKQPETGSEVKCPQSGQLMKAMGMILSLLSKMI